MNTEPKVTWVIKSDDLYWNNDEGWVESGDEATEFTEQEKNKFSLPIGDRDGAVVQWWKRADFR